MISEPKGDRSGRVGDDNLLGSAFTQTARIRPEDFRRSGLAGSAVGEQTSASGSTGHADQGPFARDGFKSAQVKLSKAQHGFDDSKHRFHRVFPAPVNGPAFLLAYIIDTTGGRLPEEVSYWMYYAPSNGRSVEHREPGGETEAEALKLLRQRLRELAIHKAGLRPFQGPKQERITVDELLQALETEYEIQGRKGIGPLR